MSKDEYKHDQRASKNMDDAHYVLHSDVQNYPELGTSTSPTPSSREVSPMSISFQESRRQDMKKTARRIEELRKATISY